MGKPKTERLRIQITDWPVEIRTFCISSFQYSPIVFPLNAWNFEGEASEDFGSKEKLELDNLFQMESVQSQPTNCFT